MLIKRRKKTRTLSNFVNIYLHLTKNYEQNLLFFLHLIEIYTSNMLWPMSHNDYYSYSMKYICKCNKDYGTQINFIVLAQLQTSLFSLSILFSLPLKKKYRRYALTSFYQDLRLANWNSYLHGVCLILTNTCFV